MRNTPIGKTINAIELVELLAAGQSDKEIATYFDCHPTVVARLRKTMMAVKPTIKTSIAAKKDDNPPTKDYVNLRANVNLMDGSDRLLKRQLEVGLHWLDKPRFIAVCKEKGWQDRLPKGLLA